jgi:hypothetical protein
MVRMRTKSALIVLAVLALGLVGIGLSTLYTQNEYSASITGTIEKDVSKVSHGFPLGWYGYTQTYSWNKSYSGHWGPPPFVATKISWFSLESLLLDVSFWFAISFFASLTAIRSARTLNLVAIARACVLGMKTSLMLLVMSLFFMVVGVGLCLVAQPYLDVGLRLIGSGTIVLIATFSVMLWKAEQREHALGARA